MSAEEKAAADAATEDVNGNTEESDTNRTDTTPPQSERATDTIQEHQEEEATEVTETPEETQQ